MRESRLVCVESARDEMAADDYAELLAMVLDDSRLGSVGAQRLA